MKPYVEICTNKVLQNWAAVKALGDAHGISVSVVTKGLTGYGPLVRALAAGGVASFCESRVQALQQSADLDVEKWMIRLPLPSEVADVVHFCDISLNTEIVTVQALGDAAVKQGRTHRVVVMIELGETREGVMPDDLVAICRQVVATPGVELHGLGTAFGCYSDIVPSTQNMATLAQCVDGVQNQLGIELPVVSGGSSSSLLMLEAGLLPTQVNHLRVGDAILTGTIPNFNKPLPGGALYPFTLSAEIVEIKTKPSRPTGDRAPDEVAMEFDPAFADRGLRRRALVGVGRQDVDFHNLRPIDDGVDLLGGSSDVLVVDLTDCPTDYQVGDQMRFSMGYFAIVPAMVSDFVDKRLV